MPDLANRPIGMRMAVLFEGGLAIVAVVLAWPLGVSLREQFPAATDELIAALLRGIVATLPLIAAFVWLVYARWPAARRLHQQTQWFVRELFHGASLTQLALVAVLAGVGEELLFRGLLQTLLGRWTTPLWGLILASIVFGLFHALSRLYVLLATLIGAYFGWLAWQFNDLTAVIVAHALYDFFALAYFAKRPPPPLAA